MLSVSIQPTLTNYAVSMPIQFRIKTYKNPFIFDNNKHIETKWLTLKRKHNET